MQDPDTSPFDDFAAEAKANSGHTSRRSCGVGALLAELSDGDAAKVREVLDDRRVSANAISLALRKRVEEAPSVFTIGAHRRRVCYCYRSETK